MLRVSKSPLLIFRIKCQIDAAKVIFLHVAYIAAHRRGLNLNKLLLSLLVKIRTPFGRAQGNPIDTNKRLEVENLQTIWTMQTKKDKKVNCHQRRSMRNERWAHPLHHSKRDICANFNWISLFLLFVFDVKHELAWRRLFWALWETWKIYENAH